MIDNPGVFIALPSLTDPTMLPILDIPKESQRILDRYFLLAMLLITVRASPPYLRIHLAMGMVPSIAGRSL